MGKPSEQGIILLMYAPPEDHLERLRALAPHYHFAVAQNEEEAASLMPDAEVVLGNRFFTQTLPYSKRLKWMQSNSVGVDLILTQKELLQKKQVTLTCARGVYDAEMAEHTLGLVLTLFRSLHLLRDEQHRISWQRHRLRSLASSRCLILGWGSLAQKIASHLTAFGAHVSAVRNQANRSVDNGITLFGRDHWEDQLPHTHLLILCLPKTPDTLHFVGKEQLEKLPKQAFVVNMGRGGTLDDDALVYAVRSQSIAGAALDVFEQEPLPKAHPIWSTPEILVSPHVGRSLEGPTFKWFGLFETNLGRYINGQSLLHQVDYARGY
jgi:phosphoglycerate dehydrogenase-like enzyme